MCATLADVWKGGGPGALSPLTQVRVWALRDAYVDTGAKAHGLQVLIATKVTKVGGGRPEAEVVRRLLARIDDDPDWYPGKTYGGKVGWAKALSGTATANIARLVGHSIYWSVGLASLVGCIVRSVRRSVESVGSACAVVRSSCFRNSLQFRTWLSQPGSK